MVFGALAAGAFGLGGGILGREDARSARRDQEGYIQAALGNQQSRYREIAGGFDAAEPYMDELLGVARGLRDDLLGQTDPIMAAQVRRIRQEREMQESLVQQNMQARGLDSFTTRMGAQSQVRNQGSNALNDLAARMSALRQSAIGTGAQAEMGALGQRSQFEQNRGMALGDVYSAMSQINSNVQIQPPNTGQAIGNLGALFLEGALGGFGG